MDPEEAESPAYAAFWNRLAAGEFFTAKFKRRAKGGREVWIQATYNPILDDEGHVVRVVKYAADITAEKQRASDIEGQLAAIHRSHAVIAFDLDGVILDANENFLRAMGYDAEEVVGRHHRMFVDEHHARSEAYAEFWRRLRDGENFSGEYPRVAKGGRTVWIAASYNPILDATGAPYKVVKFATDITAHKQVLAEVSRLVAAAQAGRLDERADAGISADLAPLMQGINAMLQAFADPVEELASVCERLAAGDLRGGLEGTYAGAFGSLKSSVNRFVDTLNDLLSGAKTIAGHVAEAGTHVRRTSAALAESASRESAAVAQSSSALTATTGQVEANARNAVVASQSVANAAEAARTGQDRMAALEEAMNDISASSQEIAKVNGVIDEIAFQTNLLASTRRWRRRARERTARASRWSHRKCEPWPNGVPAPPKRRPRSSSDRGRRSSKGSSSAPRHHRRSRASSPTSSKYNTSCATSLTRANNRRAVSRTYSAPSNSSPRARTRRHRTARSWRAPRSS